MYKLDRQGQRATVKRNPYLGIYKDRIGALVGSIADVERNVRVLEILLLEWRKERLLNFRCTVLVLVVRLS